MLQALPSLKLTNIAPENRPFAPKGKGVSVFQPIHFQGLLLLVLGRVKHGYNKLGKPPKPGWFGRSPLVGQYNSPLLQRWGAGPKTIQQVTL